MVGLLEREQRAVVVREDVAVAPEHIEGALARVHLAEAVARQHGAHQGRVALHHLEGRPQT